MPQIDLQQQAGHSCVHVTSLSEGIGRSHNGASTRQSNLWKLQTLVAAGPILQEYDAFHSG